MKWSILLFLKTINLLAIDTLSFKFSNDDAKVFTERTSYCEVENGDSICGDLFLGRVINKDSDTLTVKAKSSVWEESIIISYKENLDTLIMGEVSSAGSDRIEVLGLTKEGLYFTVSELGFMFALHPRLHYLDFATGKTKRQRRMR